MGHLLTFLHSYFFIFMSSAIWFAARSTLKAMQMHHYQSTSFIHLAEARKGEDVSGIREVKSYLHRFGYLSNLEHGTNQVGEDRFDDSLEHALLTYQEFFKLNKTGILDHDTISMMAKPRCGCPDIYNEKRNVVFNDHFKRHYRFLPIKPHPKTDHLFYEFRSDIPRPFKFKIIQAFAEWEPYLPLRFFNTVGPDRHAPDILIEFRSGEHGDGYPFDGKGNILAHANGAAGFNIHFDADENWLVGSGSDGYDVTSVARHEIGHLLGLDHSDIKSAVMYPTFDNGEVRIIGQDDIAGVKALYYS